MNIEIINKRFFLEIYGYSAVAINKDYGSTAFRLSGRLWDTVKTNNLKNKGKNIWVYESNEKVFAGIELDNIPEKEIGLELKNIALTKYAYYKHIGPYNLLKQAGLNMQYELMAKGYITTFPYIEIYGHWDRDETKLETELLVNLV